MPLGGRKRAVLQESQGILLDLWHVGEELVQDRQNGEVGRAGQTRGVDADRAVVVAAEERIVAAGI